jgi:NitT/TauT family transport system substrate-binding protein
MSTVRLMLEYFHPWTNAAGFYLARERGWYRDAGIELEIAVFDPQRGDTLAHLLRRDATFGVFPTNRLLVRREAHAPIVGIAAINHGGLETIQTYAGSGIERPAQLAGRRVAFAPTPRGVAMVRHLVAKDGGDPDAVVIVDSGRRELGVDDLQAGAADASFGGYWAWDALFGSLPPEQRRLWRVDDIGAPRYHSYLLGCQEDLLERNEAMVRAFLAATARGYAAARSAPDEALEVMERIIPYFPRSIVQRSLALIATTWGVDGRWGAQRDELMSEYAEWLAVHGILAAPERWRAAFTNELLPPPDGAPARDRRLSAA